LVEDVAGIFTENENLQAILDISGGLGMLSEMKFWEFAMFWIMGFFTLFWLVGMAVGNEMDLLDIREFNDKK
jgi:hypothetical protein